MTVNPFLINGKLQLFLLVLLFVNESIFFSVKNSFSAIKCNSFLDYATRKLRTK
jgi:hypothetical protein